jgi:ABC-type uncharacterized transport system auxiliary subunit
MAAFSVTTQKQTGGSVAQGVRELREATATIRAMSALLTEMDDAQVLASTDFSGTAAVLRSTFSAAVTALDASALADLREKLYWD